MAVDLEEKVNAMSEIRVLILWHCPYPWDVRIEKFVDVFNENGFLTRLICRTTGHADSVRSHVGTITRVGAKVGRFGKTLSVPLFFSPLWMHSLKNELERIRPDVLIVRDIPLGLLAARIGRRYGIPVILDMAENYPEALLAYENWKYKPFLIGKGYLAKRYERAVVNRVQHILVVADVQKERIAGFGVNRGHVSVIRNTPRKLFYEKARVDSKTPGAGIDRDYPYALYIGKLDIHRGVDVLIRAMAAIRTMPIGNKMKLVLVGDGKETTRLKGMAERLGVGDMVCFAGWVAHEKLPGIINESRVCVIPHYKSGHTDTTIPNKLFDYMAFGKPVVSSNLEPVRRIIEKEKCGYIYNDKNHLELAQRIVSLSDNAGGRTLGENGARAIIREYNWEHDAAALASVIRAVVKEGQG